MAGASVTAGCSVNALAQREEQEKAFSVMGAAQIGQECIRQRRLDEQHRAILC